MASETSVSRSIVLESIPMAIKGLSQDVLSELQRQNFSDEDVFAVRLALQEAFMNAVEHGNDMDSQKHITVDYMVCTDRIEIALTDEGTGFDPTSVPDPRCGKNLYKVDGRGLLLIRSYMDVVEYNERGNRIRMIRYKEKPRVTAEPD